MDIRRYLPTVLYFDIFDYPLTAVELRTWRIAWPVDESGGFSRIQVPIERRQGFYFVSGRREIVKQRKERYIVAERKFNQALKFARFFRLLPSVKMIAVCNTLAHSNTSEEGDIDFFIVTEQGKLWLTRFWLQLFLRLLRRRPFDRKGTVKDALCLSFFVSEDHLSLQDLAIDQGDIYLALWLAQLVPVYDPSNVRAALWQANQELLKLVPGAYPCEPVDRRKVPRTFWSRLFSFFSLPGWEKITKRWQMNIFPLKIKTMANQGKSVVVTDQVLKFHVNDRREYYKNLWLERLKKYHLVSRH